MHALNTFTNNKIIISKALNLYILKLIAAIRKADNELRAVEHRQDLQTGKIFVSITVPSMLDIPSLQNCRKLVMNDLPLQTLGTHTFRTIHIWEFLRGLQIQPCEVGQGGTTWLELYIMFELIG